MRQPARRASQVGTSLVELMIAVAIGLIVILAAVALYLGGARTLRVQDEASRLDDSGRFALESITRLIRVAGYVNWPGDTGAAPVRLGVADTPAVEGADGASSDRITLRFFGSTQGAAADGAIVDCLGVPVPRDGDPATRTENVLSVSTAGALLCQATGMSSPQPLIDGVERLQFLYGLDLDGDGRPERWLRAAEVTNWRAVRAVRVALLMASATSTRNDADSAVYELFGPGYSVSGDGALLDTRTLSAAERRRLRRVYSAVVAVRNGG
jgi:type IV pilus assembly protein PilW